MNIHPKRPLIRQIAHFYRLRYPKVPGGQPRSICLPLGGPTINSGIHNPNMLWLVRYKNPANGMFSLVTILRLLY